MKKNPFLPDFIDKGIVAFYLFVAIIGNPIATFFTFYVLGAFGVVENTPGNFTIVDPLFRIVVLGLVFWLRLQWWYDLKKDSGIPYKTFCSVFIRKHRIQVLGVPFFFFLIKELDGNYLMILIIYSLLPAILLQVILVLSLRKISS